MFFTDFNSFRFSMASFFETFRRPTAVFVDSGSVNAIYLRGMYLLKKFIYIYIYIYIYICISVQLRYAEALRNKHSKKNPDIYTNLKKLARRATFGLKLKTFPGKRGLVVALVSGQLFCLPTQGQRNE